MSASTPEDIKKHVRTYIMVFVALAILTAVTVGVSYLHLPTFETIIVALVIATVKGSLVAAFFMHLISERSTIYWVLGICVVLFAVLMTGPALTTSEMHQYAKVDTSEPAHLETGEGHH
jgi:cytochrome c oxidase subunit IV